MSAKQKSEGAKQPVQSTQTRPELPAFDSQATIEDAVAALNSFRAASPPPLKPSEILALQKSVGNRIVQRLLDEHNPGRSNPEQAVGEYAGLNRRSESQAIEGEVVVQNERRATHLQAHPLTSSGPFVPTIQRTRSAMRDYRMNLVGEESEYRHNVHVRSIRYSLEHSQAHRGMPEMFVVYVHQCVVSDAPAHIAVDWQPVDFESFIHEGEGPSDSWQAREDFIMARIAEEIFNEDPDLSNFETDNFFQEERAVQGGSAYSVRNPSNIRADIRRALTGRSGPPRRREAAHERMPGGETPEQWSGGPYSPERRDAAIAWLRTTYGALETGGLETYETQRLENPEYDVERIAQRNRQWIVPFREAIRSGTRPPRGKQRSLFDFWRTNAGTPVTAGSDAIGNLRQALELQGVGDGDVREFWNWYRQEWLAPEEPRGPQFQALRRRLVQIQCGNPLAIARRLTGAKNVPPSELSSVDASIRPIVEMLRSGSLPNMRELRARLGLQGPSDQAIVQFWQNLTSPGADDAGLAALSEEYTGIRYAGRSARETGTEAVIPIRDFRHFNTGIELAFAGASGPSAQANRCDVDSSNRPIGLDPQFLVAFLQLLRALRASGVRILFHNSFYRPPLSPADAHAGGRAVDISGFGIETDGGIVRLDLFRGRDRPRTEGRGRSRRRVEGSDWYDANTLLPDGRSHRQVMLELSQVLSRYFSFVIGPGHDPRHNDHFHCEIARTASRGSERGSRVFDVPATPIDPHPERRGGS